MSPDHSNSLGSSAYDRLPGCGSPAWEELEATPESAVWRGRSFRSPQAADNHLQLHPLWARPLTDLPTSSRSRPRPDLPLHRDEEPLASLPMTAQVSARSSPLRGGMARYGHVSEDTACTRDKPRAPPKATPTSSSGLRLADM
jgi:hypothetical protein